MTRTEILASMDRLGSRLGRRLEMSMWSPGDGWTRYQVIDGDSGRELYGTWRVYRKHEIEVAIQASHYILDIVAGH